MKPAFREHGSQFFIKPELPGIEGTMATFQELHLKSRKAKRPSGTVSLGFFCFDTTLEGYFASLFLVPLAATLLGLPVPPHMMQEQFFDFDFPPQTTQEQSFLRTKGFVKPDAVVPSAPFRQHMTQEQGSSSAAATLRGLPSHIIQLQSRLIFGLATDFFTTFSGFFLAPPSLFAFGAGTAIGPGAAGARLEVDAVESLRSVANMPARSLFKPRASLNRTSRSYA